MTASPPATPSHAHGVELGEWPSMLSPRTFSGQSILFLAARSATLIVLAFQAAAQGSTVLLVLALAALGIDIAHTALQGLIQVRGLALQRWVKQLVVGNLDYHVEMPGNDEISLYGRILEALRQSLIRSRDLEREQKELSEELRKNNETLKSTLETLRTRQDQIVSQQKLAELGELSAGVAHEIRNPLQFIKNFAESSAHLVAELNELLARPDADTDAPAGTDAQGEIAELAGELSDNMDRISQHSRRANRIVSDMLDLGSGGSQNFRPANLNRMLVEQTTVARHAARDRDDAFDVRILEDLDESLGEVRVVPRDMARVFANIVSNAFHALAEKRGAGDGFRPTLRLRTRRLEEAVEVSIRDNGTGMTPEVMAKVFNPFFTTKDPNQGTGLGMSLSHDIVRQHGGTVTPASVAGEYTEMTLRIPLGDQRDEPGEEEPGEGRD